MTSWYVALAALLRDLFVPAEVTRLVETLDQGDQAAAALPLQTSPSEYYWAVVQTLKRFGLLNTDFFDALRAARPLRTADIDRLERSRAATPGALRPYLDWVQRHLGTIPAPFGIASPQPVDKIYIPPQVTVRHCETEEDSLQVCLDAARGHLGITPTRETEMKSVEDLLTVIQERHHVLLFGDAGTGKSHFLQYLAMTAAHGFGAGQDGFAPLDIDLEGRLPVFVKLEQLARWTDGQATSALGRLRSCVLRGLDEHGLSGSARAVWSAVEAGQALVLFEGLDEVASAADLQGVCGSICDLATAHAANRVVVTSRPLPGLDSREFLTSTFHEALLQPLSNADVHRLLAEWRPLVARYPPTQPPVRHALPEDILGNPATQAMFRTPLYAIALLCVGAASSHALVTNRSHLYELLLPRMVARHTGGLPNLTPSEIDDIVSFLQELALEMLQKRSTVVTRDEYRARIRRRFGSAAASWPVPSARLVERIDQLLDLGGVFRPSDRGFAFFHKSVQEFLAARQVCRGPDDARSHIRPHLDDDYWKEVIVSIAAILARERGSSTAGEILDAESHGPPEPSRAILAGECLVQEREVQGVPEVQVRRVISGLLATARNLAVPLDRRRRAAEVLGLLGDPRLDALEPAMVAVPAGPFRMGSTREECSEYADRARNDRLGGDWADYPDEVRYILLSLYGREEWPGDGLVHVPAFRIGRYPVTNLQYQPFVEAQPHRAPRAWSGGARPPPWAAPYTWQGATPPPGRENHPVVLVRYEDAEAYCTWLSGLSGRRYRLPTEAEWEKAARGPDGRRHPWGNRLARDDCGNLCNIKHTGFNETVPVGIFPGGRSVYGAEDMVGNVWEWTSTRWGVDSSAPDYLYPFANDGRDAPGEIEILRIVRGGSWSTDASRARCAYRTIDVPGTRNLLSVGFRLALSDIPD